MAMIQPIYHCNRHPTLSPSINGVSPYRVANGRHPLARHQRHVYRKAGKEAVEVGQGLTPRARWTRRSRYFRGGGRALRGGRFIICFASGHVSTYYVEETCVDPITPSHRHIFQNVFRYNPAKPANQARFNVHRSSEV